MVAKESPATVAAASGAESNEQRTFAANCNPWQRWALEVPLERLSARQRRALLLLAAGLAATPEHAFRTLDARV